ncbi:MAG: hypothetical protein V3573_02600 [Desulfovibrionaceae bacterium]
MKKHIALVELECAAGEFGLWQRYLLKGARFSVRVGVSLWDILVVQFGLSPEYVEERVRTIFVNGCPVDDLHLAVVDDGAQIALAGAMPGLVGVCMGRNSPVAGFRNEITYHAPDANPRPGEIVLKLFNTVALEIGPKLLEWGILLDGRDLAQLVESFQDQSKHWRVRVDGCDSECGALARQEGLVRLRIAFVC